MTESFLAVASSDAGFTSDVDEWAKDADTMFDPW